MTDEPLNSEMKDFHYVITFNNNGFFVSFKFLYSPSFCIFLLVGPLQSV